jgi:hypothetical protein
MKMLARCAVVSFGAFLFACGWVTYAISTSDENDGTTKTVLRDKNGAWTCTLNEQGGACTDPQGKTASF